MAVRNPNRKGPRKALPPNKEPSSKRGKRRSQKTQEYQDNCATRQQQSYPRANGTRGCGGKGPLKGPSKTSGVSEFKSYMSGGK